MSRRRRQKHKGFRLSIGVGVAIAGVLVLALLLVVRDTSVSFEKAAANPELREEFLAQVAQEYPPPPQVKVLRYGTSEVLETVRRVHEVVPEQDTLAIANPLESIPFSQVGRRELPLRITVFAAAFDASFVQNKQDFVSLLLHEYDHARQMNQLEVAGFSYRQDFRLEGSGEVSITLVNIVHELEAFRKEIRRVVAPSWNSSELFIERRHFIYMEQYGRLLEHARSGPPVPADVQERMIIEFFEPWMKRTPFFSVSSEGEPIITHPETKREYILPRTILSFSESQ